MVMSFISNGAKLSTVFFSQFFFVIHVVSFFPAGLFFFFLLKVSFVTKLFSVIILLKTVLWTVTYIKLLCCFFCGILEY